MNLAPIGYYHCPKVHKQALPRQAQLQENSGIIELNAGMNFETALRDLAGMERIWIIFIFDRNHHWRPTTTPPIPLAQQERLGIFATRSPYRPNPLGLSCLRLEKVQGRKLWVQGADLLDQTPILDIKPYLPQFDSFPQSKIGWMEKQNQDQWQVDCTPHARAQLTWILQNGGPDLWAVANVQLSTAPFAKAHKRILWQDTSGVLAVRTWSLKLQMDLSTKSILVTQVVSNYTPLELELQADIYQDKELHHKFLALCGSTF